MKTNLQLWINLLCLNVPANVTAFLIQSLQPQPTHHPSIWMMWLFLFMGAPWQQSAFLHLCGPTENKCFYLQLCKWQNVKSFWSSGKMSQIPILGVLCSFPSCAILDFLTSPPVFDSLFFQLQISTGLYFSHTSLFLTSKTAELHLIRKTAQRLNRCKRSVQNFPCTICHQTSIQTSKRQAQCWYRYIYTDRSKTFAVTCRRLGK